MTGNFLLLVKRLTLSLLIICFGSAGLFAQGGTIINSYAKVLTRVDNYNITVDNASEFHSGDYVLIIQMKGISIDADNTNLYGNIADTVGVPGQYEFLIVNSVVGNTISFLSQIKNYDPSGYVQIVKVQYYNNAATLNDKLTCKQWANGTGGVLALIVTGSLRLNADIDVSGKGFNGGIVDPNPSLGSCAGTIGINEIYSFPSSFLEAGYKGEGSASHYTPFVGASPILLSPDLRGKGPLFSGGGGGNGRFSGGGGGSNRGLGYRGGFEDLFCNFQYAGGDPGNVVESQIDPVSGGIFMGGGGGSSTHLAGASATPGGNGGGIVFILADSFDGNGRSIIASGDSAKTATGIYSGAGGGGAGGSIMIFAQNYTANNFTVRANGAKGGDVRNDWSTTYGGGVGGAGGGGYIAFMKPASDVTVDVSGGGPSFMKNSVDPPENQLNGGNSGLSRSNVNPVLTGFLFNSIKSEVTGNQVDSICSNVLFSKITGTSPMGGVLPYDFEWQRSTVSESTGFVTIAGATGKDYSPPALLTQTTWFRRIVRDHTATPIVDISMPVQIIVQNAITNNAIITSPDTICFNGDPQLIRQITPDLIVPSISTLRFSWQESPSGTIWGPEFFTGKEYDPGILTVDKWYRRTVYSGRCIDSSATVRIKVLSKLAGNVFPVINESNDTICFGGNTDLNSISQSPLTGGLTTDYRYIWLSSSTNLPNSWSQVGSTEAIYDPDALAPPLSVGDHFYRRIVLSGELNACVDTSNAAARKVWPVITNNHIQAAQTIGYDSIPAKLTEDLGPPAGGSGVYSYLWLKDTVNFPVAPVGPSGNTGKDYQPVNQKYTISFIRKVNSSACSSNSNSIKITVDQKIGNSISMVNPAKDVIYTGQLSSKLNGSVPTGGSGIANDYSFRWYKSLTGGPSKSEWVALTDSMNLSPGYLTVPTWFRRDVSSPKALPRGTTQSNVIKITVLPKIANVDISTTKSSVCYGFRPLKLKGSTLTGGDGSYKFTWQDSTSGHTWANISGFVHCDSADYKPQALVSPAGYRRIVYSGKNDCGVETSNSIVINVNPMPAEPYAGPDTMLFSITDVYHMQALRPPDGESGKWSVLSGTGETEDDSYNTKVRWLSPDKNEFYWTVSRGECKDSDLVLITLKQDLIPQGFSPNGDNKNDKFYIQGLFPEDNDIELSIMNGAGAEVFSVTNRNGDPIEWDGTDLKGNYLPEGTYYYLLKITPKNSKDGKVHKQKGFIILKRY